MKSKGFSIFVAAVVIIALYMSAYVVDETQQVVITQFGKVVGEPVTEPGLRFKLPFVQKATYFPKNLLHWDGDPGQIPTLDKTFIWVDTFARWRIVDPVKFFQTVNNINSAQYRLNDIIDPAVRNLITENRLIETVRATSRQLGAGFGDDDHPLGGCIRIGAAEHRHAALADTGNISRRLLQLVWIDVAAATDDDVLEQSCNEKRFGASAEHGLTLPIEPIGVGQLPKHAVDGGALLGPAGKVYTAQQGGGLKATGGKGVR